MQTILTRLFLAVLILSASLLVLSACGGGGGGDGDGSTPAVSTAGVGTVSVSLTDNQTGYNAVVLTIKEIGILASNTTSTYYNSSDLDNLPLTVNILDFPEEATLHLADIEVDLPENGAPVCFSQIRLVLAAEGDPACGGELCNYVVEIGDPTKYPLKTPSGQQSGVKVKAHNEFCVEEGDDAVNVSIDFDPMTAIVHTGNQNNNNDKYILKPTGIRIIEGNWFVAPDSYIDGLVAVPTYNTANGCGALATTPVVTIAAYYNSATLTDPPVVQTVALAEGPVYNSAVCETWCGDSPVYNSCRLDCGAFLTSPCYYSGQFKLLLPDKETYDLTATWEGLYAEELDVAYNSSVLMELTE